MTMFFFEKGNGDVFSGAKLIEVDFATDSEVFGRYIRKLGIIPEVYGNAKGQGRLKIIKKRTTSLLQAYTGQEVYL